MKTAERLGPVIEIVDGQPLTKREDGGMHRSTVAELVAELQYLRKENAVLHNLAENLKPGPISEALTGTLHVANWQQRAAYWLRRRAADQEVTNQQFPAHAAEHESWRQKPTILRMWADTLAGKLEDECNNPESTAWLVYFEDPDHGHEAYIGAGADEAAIRRYHEAKTKWSCHLFVRVDGIDRHPPAWQQNRLWWAVRQLLDMLPQRRDWLDPEIEDELRKTVGKPR